MASRARCVHAIRTYFHNAIRRAWAKFVQHSHSSTRARAAQTHNSRLQASETLLAWRRAAANEALELFRAVHRHRRLKAVRRWAWWAAAAARTARQITLWREQADRFHLSLRFRRLCRRLVSARGVAQVRGDPPTNPSLGLIYAYR